MKGDQTHSTNTHTQTTKDVGVPTNYTGKSAEVPPQTLHKKCEGLPTMSGILPAVVSREYPDVVRVNLI